MMQAATNLRVPLSEESKTIQIPYVFSQKERHILKALSEVAIPGGELLHRGDWDTVERLNQHFAQAGSRITKGYRALLQTFSLITFARYRRLFSQLSQETRETFLHKLEEVPFGVGKQLVRLLLTPIKMVHVRDPGFFQRLEIPFETPIPIAPLPRYFSQVQDGSKLEKDETIEADVVVIGSGAGGAVVAKELAAKGFATVILEEGQYFTRKDFRADTGAMLNKMYRGQGITASLGSPMIPIPLGMTVGGSTTVNSGTCLRAKASLFRRWRHEDGLAEFTEDHLTPYYDRVEGFLGVTPNGKYTGKLGKMIALGCERLGIQEHGPLPRNAPDCDGQGLCCFGCPTDAKKSANVSWIPAALQNGAFLYSRSKAVTILRENGKASGVIAKAGSKDKPVSLTVRAPIVVIACGSIMTPVFLEQNQLGRSSGALGRNLTIHPAVSVAGLFDEEIRAWNTVPQGYEISEFIDEGILFEGAFGRPDLVSLSFPSFGKDFVRLMEHYHKMIVFGFMISDSTRGRVRQDPRTKRPVITYQINAVDVSRIQRGIELLGQIYFAAGAKEIVLPIHGNASLFQKEELVAFRGKKIPNWSFELSAYHPLGTCRMGPDPRSSVVSPNHELHDLANCYVIDGSTVNGPLGVNPQLTIMAMALRASERIAKRFV